MFSKRILYIPLVCLTSSFFVCCKQFKESKIHPGLYQAYQIVGDELKELGQKHLTITNSIGYVKFGESTLRFDASGTSPAIAYLLYPSTNESLTYKEIVERFKEDYENSSDLQVLITVGRRFRLNDVLMMTIERDDYDNLTAYERFKEKGNLWSFWRKTSSLPISSIEYEGKIVVSKNSLTFNSNNGQIIITLDKID